MMTNDYAAEAAKTFAIRYRNGNPPLLRPSYPAPNWEGIVRAAHLSRNIDCVFVMDGTEEAEKMALELQAINDREAEREDIELEVEVKDTRIQELESTVDTLVENSKKQSELITQLLARLAVQDAPPVKVQPAKDGGAITQEYLNGLDINSLRSLAVSYKASGAGTKDDLIERILEQIANNVIPQ